MKYRAEIFDEFQYLYETTGYSDHQVRCVISFANKVDAAVMKRAAELLIKTIPILSRTYKNFGGSSYWEDAESSELQDLFTVVDNKNDFDRFSGSKTNEATGPQIKFCLLQADRGSLSIVINHMVSDAAGFKACVYLFSDIYSKLIKDQSYVPDFVIDGGRGFKAVLNNISLVKQIKLLLTGSKDNNQESDCEFSMSESEDTVPFIVTHEIAPETYRNIRNYCHSESVTVNDVILTAYFRALSEKLDMKGKELAVPIMIDMRRYLQDKSFLALTNLSSTTIVRVTVSQDEEFGETLFKVSSVMNKKKANNLGLNTFLKLDAGFKIPLLNVYNILRKSLKNPKICMTNIGILDSSKLIFENSEVMNAAMFGSIKYRPYFQMSVTSFSDKMTLGTGLYGTQQDRANIEGFYDLMDSELGNVSVIADMATS